MKARAGMTLTQPDSRFPGTLPELIAQGADLLSTGRTLQLLPAIDLNAVRLLPPAPKPPKILCVGLNYDDHLEESGLKKPAYPEIFARFATSLWLFLIRAQMLSMVSCSGGRYLPKTSRIFCVIPLFVGRTPFGNRCHVLYLIRFVRWIIIPGLWSRRGGAAATHGSWPPPRARQAKHHCPNSCE